MTDTILKQVDKRTIILKRMDYAINHIDILINNINGLMGGEIKDYLLDIKAQSIKTKEIFWKNS